MAYQREHGYIQNVFKGKNVFITGGSGFIGKALIEKLLRSCPEIGKIYILLRPKKGKSPSDRVEQILSSPVFDLLKSSFPENFKKIFQIKGDSCEAGLGISEDDRKLLTAEVNIFFNIAASVKFDNLLKDAIISNLRSAREAALLALEMKNIEVFLHVSTSYCNIDNRKYIREILYPAPQSWREAIKLAENCDAGILSIVSLKYTEGFSNTYIFTKRLAEHCINDLLVGKIPTIISRPSVVVASLEEPFQGWSDNLNGPTGLVLGALTGVLRIMYGNPEIDTDYFPVDNTVKSMIVSAWHKVEVCGKQHELSIYHVTKSGSVELKQNKLIKVLGTIYWDVPVEKKIWYTRTKITTSWYEYYINVILFHMVPALLIDMLLKIVGYPPILLKAQRKIYIANMALCDFMINEWKFDNENHKKLFTALPPKERSSFNFNIYTNGESSVYDYFCHVGNYCRIHFLKENREITEANIIRTRRMYYLDMVLRYAFYLLAAWIVFIKINVPKILWDTVYEYWEGL